MSEVWESPRKIEEEIKAYRVKVVDRLADLALDGIITMPQYIQACEQNTDELFVPTEIETNPELVQ